ncbi:MAG: hypothetical protein ACOH2D_17330 [Gelidibacter sp.]
MKKLSLKNLKLGADDMLQRSQLKTVFGGYGGGSCQSWVNGTHSTGLSVSDAQGDYAFCIENGYSSCGYCCASC